MRHTRGQRDHRRSRGSCDRYRESSMGGRSSAAHVVIVHARQVIVDERIGVYDLDSGGDSRCVSLPARSAVRSEDKHASEPLSAAGEGVDDGGANRLRDIQGFLLRDFGNGAFDLGPVI